MWHQRPEEMPNAVRDEAVKGRSSANRAWLKSPFCCRGRYSTKVRASILDQAADSVDQRDASLRLPRDEPVRARKALRARVGEFLCFCVDGCADVSVESV